jgi:RHS repeat-associated protein
MTTARFVVATFHKIPTAYATNYYHTDAIGSVRAITDQSGTTVIRHDYFPFGEDTQPLTGDPMRFGGLELDAESGLNYAGARYYRNIWGRFMRVDPVGGTLTNPQRWNGYAYALNNPLRFVDPTGTFSRGQDPNLGDPANPCTWDFSDSCGDTQEYYCYMNPGCTASNFEMSEMQADAATAPKAAVDAVLDGYMVDAGVASAAKAAAQQSTYTVTTEETSFTIAPSTATTGSTPSFTTLATDVSHRTGAVPATLQSGGRLVLQAAGLLPGPIGWGATATCAAVGCGGSSGALVIASLRPVSGAAGAHTVFKYGGGRVSKYATFSPQTNPRDPRAWQRSTMFHGSGNGHYNKVTG